MADDLGQRAVDVAQIGAQLGALALDRRQVSLQLLAPRLQNRYGDVVVHARPVVAGPGYPERAVDAGGERWRVLHNSEKVSTPLTSAENHKDINAFAHNVGGEPRGLPVALRNPAGPSAPPSRRGGGLGGARRPEHNDGSPAVLRFTPPKKPSPLDNEPSNGVLCRAGFQPGPS